MLVNGKPWHTVWHDPGDPDAVHIIDQRALPFHFVTERLTSVAQVAEAIADMHVRGAGCIGATAAWGMYLAALADTVEASATQLIRARPTAVNLSWAVQRQLRTIAESGDKVEAARRGAAAICDEDIAACRAIGQHGLPLISTIAASRPGPVNILTHCNAGWLAFVDIGSATAPIYAAHDAGIPVHVWVGETRPRNQGARLTTWELAAHGVPHTLITDNAGGHLIQRGQVDLVITGADRVTRTGDVANKIGTYLKPSPPKTAACRSTSPCLRPLSITLSRTVSAFPLKSGARTKFSSWKTQSITSPSVLRAPAPRILVSTSHQPGSSRD